MKVLLTGAPQDATVPSGQVSSAFMALVESQQLTSQPHAQHPEQPLEQPVFLNNWRREAVLNPKNRR